MSSNQLVVCKEANCQWYEISNNETRCTDTEVFVTHSGLLGTNYKRVCRFAEGAMRAVLIPTVENILERASWGSVCEFITDDGHRVELHKSNVFDEEE